MRNALLTLGIPIAVAAVAAIAIVGGLIGADSAQAVVLPVDAMSIDMDPFNPIESGADCTNDTDEDGDGFVNDGCPQVGGVSEAQLSGACANAVNDDTFDSGDTTVNDGCPAVGNTISFVADRDTCAQVNENNVLDLDEDSQDAKLLDVTAEGIPPYDAGSDDNGMLAFTYRFNYDSAGEPNLTVSAADSVNWKINEAGGSLPSDASQALPDTPSGGDGYWVATVSDTGSIPANLEGGDGVLTRITLSTDAAAAPAVYPLTLTFNAVLDNNNVALATTTVNNANLAVSVGATVVSCPNPTDIAVTSVTTTAPASGTAGTPFNVTADVEIDNLGPVDDINVDTQITLNLPSDCTTQDTNPVTVQDTNTTLAGGPFALAQQSWDVTCTDPSNHSFDTTAVATIDDTDATESSVGNNTLTSTPPEVVAVSAESDLSVTSVTIVPPGGTSTVGTAFDVTARVAVANAGPFGPAIADVTADLTLPQDCTTGDPDPQTVQNQSIPLAGTNVDVAWSVTCTDRSDHSFSASGSVAVDQTHVTDPGAGNNGPVNSQPANIEVFAQSDLKVASVTVTAPENSPINTDFDVTVDATVHNNGPFGPVQGDVTVALNLPTDCTASVVPNQPGTVNLQTSTATPLTQLLYTVSCSQPSAHVFSADVSIEIFEEELHVTDSTADNNSDTGEDTTAVTAAADLKVMAVTADAPATATADEPFDVTVDATLHNNGPFTPALADALVTLDLPTGCTSSPATKTASGVSLPAATDTAMPQQTLAVTCTSDGSKSISATIDLTPQLHVIDAVATNDAGESDVLAVNVGAAATATPGAPPPTGGEPPADIGGGAGSWPVLYAAVIAVVGAAIAGAGVYGLRRRADS